MPITSSCGSYISPKNQHGFSLIEIVVGIVVLSISLAIISTLFAPATRQSGELVQQIKAAELAQSFMNEIMGRAYDDNSDMFGGATRCGEAAVSCTTTIGSEAGEIRATFDDVDDYHGLDLQGNLIQTSLGQTIGQEYLNYRVQVSVTYDSNYDGVDDANVNIAKRVTVTVTTPLGERIEFTSFKANF